ncbi:hypothetical protein [Xenorhabdus szentirmaii]|nr:MULTISPECIES: hypothetical protein [unclassified Xenorhabdus]
MGFVEGAGEKAGFFKPLSNGGMNERSQQSSAPGRGKNGVD